MYSILKNSGKALFAFVLFFYSIQNSSAGIKDSPADETRPTSSQAEAIKFIEEIKTVSKSDHWPNIKPELLLENISINVHHPLSMYPGRGTNFCGYGALSYLLLQDDPLGYAKFMLALYKDGKATMGQVNFTPGDEIKKVAGSLKYKGLLDIRPAEQMLYLTLADHFKGYLNIFNRHYDAGDENTFWASVNYAKFNRMVRTLLNYKVYARGTDLIRPSVGNTYNYISSKLKQGIVVLYLNNRILHKKKHENIKLKIPTHFVILENISNTDGMITMVYWDYGGKTLLQIQPEFLHKIIFGISLCIKKGVIEK